MSNAHFTRLECNFSENITTLIKEFEWRQDLIKKLNFIKFLRNIDHSNEGLLILEMTVEMIETTLETSVV